MEWLEDRRNSTRINPWHIVSMYFSSMPVDETNRESRKRQGWWGHVCNGVGVKGYRIRLVATMTDEKWAVLEEAFEKENSVPPWMSKRRQEIERSISKEGAVLWKKEL